MSVHSLTWRVNCSAIDDLEVVRDACEWLVGAGTESKEEVTRSWHGAEQMIWTCRIENRGPATVGIARIGTELLHRLAEDRSWLEDRIDEDRNLHLRLDLATLATGRVALAGPADAGSSVKGRIKLAVYPNQEPLEIAQEVLRSALRTAEENGWRGVHPDRDD